jgi:general secretion pathway protein B
MSFILDALRKSENERQRNQTPGMANMQAQGKRKGSGIWLPLVALLVGVNLSLIVVMWLLSDEKQSASTPTPATTTGNQDNVVSSAPGRRLTEELTPANTAKPANQQGNAALPAQTTDVAPSTSYDQSVDDNIPTLAELQLANAISVPPLHLDIHVYSETSSERFVFINMSRYNEGGTLDEGPKVVRISKSGVVLRHQGQDFMMVREQ